MVTHDQKAYMNRFGASTIKLNVLIGIKTTLNLREGVSVGAFPKDVTLRVLVLADNETLHAFDVIRDPCKALHPSRR